MSKQTRNPSWASPLSAAVLAGVVVAVVEVLTVLRISGPVRVGDFLLPAVLLYGVAAGILGLIVLVASAALRRRPPSSAFTGSLAAALFGFLLVAGSLHLYVLPPVRNPVSLGATALMMVAFAGIGVGLFRLFTVLGERWIRPGWHRVGLGGSLWILSAAVVLVSTVAFLLPPARGEKVSAAAEARSDVNVVVIVVDALRTDHVSAYGYERETTPNVDRLARDGVLFERAISHAPWTKPAVASILTGRYPSSHGAILEVSKLADDVPLLWEILQKNGYRTGVFCANFMIAPLFGFDRGADHFHGHAGSRFTRTILGYALGILGDRNRVPEWIFMKVKAAEFRLTLRGGSAARLSAEGLTAGFLELLDEKAPGPFFAYVHYMEVHTPYSPPAPYDEKFMPPRLREMPRVVEPPNYPTLLPFDRGKPMSADSLQNMVALYDGAVSYVDRCVGTLVGELKRRGLYDRTLILLTADHGDEFFDHGGWGHKHSLYQEILHVPMIASCPSVIGRGARRIPRLVRHVDILPTVLEVAGVEPPDGIDGASLVPILRGEETPDPPGLAMSEADYKGREQFVRSLLAGREKIIYARRGDRGHLSLFDLDADPGEENNLADSDPTRAEELFAALEEIHSLALGRAAAGVTVTIDEETREHLRALGYLQ